MDWKDSKQERGEDDKNSDSGIEAPQISRERRPDLVAIGGLRFLATFFLLFGSTAETLWIDNGHEVTASI